MDPIRRSGGPGEHLERREASVQQRRRHLGVASVARGGLDLLPPPRGSAAGASYRTAPRGCFHTVRYGDDHGIEWDVDIYWEGKWIGALDGAIAQSEWTQIDFATGTVAKMRLQAHSARSTDLIMFLREVDFRDATASSP
jgi:hypothetical protein